MRLGSCIALGLLIVAGLVAAAPMVRRGPFLEERCSPAVPTGEAVALEAEDRIDNEVGYATRTIDFAPATWPARATVRTCAPYYGEVAPAEGDGRGALRVTVRAWGDDPYDAVEEVEVKARAVIVDGTIVFVPRIQMRGSDRLPQIEVSLLVPDGVRTEEAWS